MAEPKIWDVTDLLHLWSDGDHRAGERAFAALYAELHRLADHYMRAERAGHTLQPTALVHEAYLRIVARDEMVFKNRQHFVACAATAMRRVLVDHARARRAAKRGGNEVTVALGEAADSVAEEPAVDIHALDEALVELAARHPLSASIVELRYFGGLTIEATAQVLGCSRATVIRYWRTARAWLFQRLK